MRSVAVPGGVGAERPQGCPAEPGECFGRAGIARMAAVRKCSGEGRVGLIGSGLSVVGVGVRIMQLRYAFRLDPGSGQRVALARAFGCARVVYNDAVARERARREGAAFPSAGVLSRTLITEAKQSRERQWLSEVSAVILRGQRDRHGGRDDQCAGPRT
ncbi:helix-turn-helix domain-containing protein [Streptomyces mirabilis]|uniref:helix-turn-helix domain-containing protein n=2 Tax=Streptomyces mirabilis TaxID=68239 RepID=UPI00368546F8